MELIVSSMTDWWIFTKYSHLVDLFHFILRTLDFNPSGISKFSKLLTMMEDRFYLKAQKLVENYLIILVLYEAVL